MCNYANNIHDLNEFKQQFKKYCFSDNLTPKIHAVYNY